MGTRFDLEQPVAVGADEMVDALVDPEFWPRLGELESVDPPEVLSATVADGRASLRIRYRLTAELPGLARRWIDPDDLCWVDETEVDLTSRSGTFRIVPVRYTHLLEGDGSWTVEPVGDDSCVQHYRGRVNVRLPMVGKAVEGGIVNGLIEQLAGVAVLVERHHATG